jgi:PII-like signaling protein
MQSSEEAVLLRIFVGDEDRFNRRALYKAIVEKALNTGMAGATVLRGPYGFGHSGRLRSELNVDAGSPFPVVVEIVDSVESIERFLPVIDKMMESGIITMEKVRAIYYDTPKSK